MSLVNWPPPAELAGLHAVVWGVGSHDGGLASASTLATAGARVGLLDAATPSQQLASAAAGMAQGWPWHIGGAEHPALRRCHLVVPNPAIAPAVLATVAVHTTGVQRPLVIAPDALGLAMHTGKRILITGTKGKSTTAQALGTLLDWPVVGNSNTPILRHLLNHHPGAPMVIEASSFQLWYLASSQPRLDACAITMLDTDHLDWHGSREAYHAAKLAALQWSDAVLTPTGVAAPTGARSISPVSVVDGWFHHPDHGAIAPRNHCRLLGEHNAANVAMALALALDHGLDPGMAAIRLAQIEALPHRLQTVASHSGRTWINDSTATTPVAVNAALNAIPGPLTVLLGGADKGSDLAPLAAAVAARGAKAVCMGTTGATIAADLDRQGISAPLAEDLPEAVAEAIALTPPDGTILLAPGCAATDQFRDFAARGDAFSELARHAAE